MELDPEWFRGGTVVRRTETGPFSIGSDPVAFPYGVELMNDDTTPMQFVISCAETHIGLDQETAYFFAHAIHKYGRAVAAVASELEAGRIAEAILSQARDHNFPLVCRAVSAQQSAQRRVETTRL